MPPVDCLIFSRNRPAQLDLLLRSIALFDTGLIRKPVTVLCRFDSEAFAAGYAIVQEEHGWVDWRIERDDSFPASRFEAQVRGWLRMQEGPIMFLCDDNVFYRPIAWLPLDGWVRETLPWSFRGGDYHYPFSVDGCVYDAQAVRDLIAGHSFATPTSLEVVGHGMRGRWSKDQRTFAEMPRCLTNVPLNRVSHESGMFSLGVDPEYLNSQFLKGWRLVLPPDRDYPPHAEILLTLDNPRRRQEVGAA